MPKSLVFPLRKTKYAYDKLNRLKIETNAVGDTFTYSYDKAGNVIETSNELGQKTQYSYDGINRQTKVTRITADSNLVTTTEYTNDTENNLLVLTVTDAVGRETVSRTDGRGRLIEFVNADDTTTTYTYDGNDNLLTVVDELGRQTTYSYDLLNREITVTTPLGNTTTTEYDSNSNVVKITDHLNNATRYTYNELDLLTTETDARGFVTTYTYDSEENLASVQDPLDNVTTYTYDNLNRLFQETAVGVGTRTYSYDEVSNLIQLLDRNGRIVQFAYDDWNRQTAELWLDGDRIVNTISYSYDAASQLVDVEDSVAKYSYEYDDDSRLTKEIRDTFGFTDEVVLDYTHDGVGNVLTVTDTVGGIQLSTETYTYDARDRVISISQTGNGVTPKTAVVTYDDAGQLEQLEVLNAFSTAQTFDLDGRPVTRTHTTAVGEVLAYGYEFDEVNRITAITSPNGESSFSYDGTDQLTSASSDFQEDESYDYDETGNRLGNEIGPHNRLLNDGVYSYSYDAEGNRIQRIELATGVVTDYEWDWRNRLVEVSESNELGEVLSSSQYQYDAFDRRLTKLVDSNGDGIYELVEGFVYNDDSILLVLGAGESDSALTEVNQRYFYGPGTDWVLAEETAGEGVEYALTNHLNSVEFILDSAGEVINRIIYDSFGGITSETNPGVDVRYGFTGRDFDKETGLGYNRTRYYDFVTGTFVSVDRLGFEAGDVNLYRYVGNSPTIYVDPSGMIVETIWDVASVVLGVASFAYNIYQGVRNRERSYFEDAGLDLVGIAADVGAVFLPGAPAVGAATIRAGRFASRAETAIEIAQVANVGVNAYQGVVSTQESVRAFRDGDYAGGIGHGIGATLSFGGAATSILGSAPGSAGNLARKGGNVINDIFGGGSGPRGGSRLANAAVIGNGSLPKSGIEGVNVNRIDSGDTPGGVNGSTRATDTGTVEGTGTASNLDDNQPARMNELIPNQGIGSDTIRRIDSLEGAYEAEVLLNTAVTNPEDIEERASLLSRFVEFKANEYLITLSKKGVKNNAAFAMSNIPTLDNSLTNFRVNIRALPSKWEKRNLGGIKIYGSGEQIDDYGNLRKGQDIFQITDVNQFIAAIESELPSTYTLNHVTKNLILNRIGKFNHNTSSFEADETKFFSSDHGIPGLHAEILALNDTINSLTDDGKNLQKLTQLSNQEIHIATYKLSGNFRDNLNSRDVETLIAQNQFFVSSPFEACLNCGIIIPESPIVPEGPIVKVITGRKLFTEQNLEVDPVKEFVNNQPMNTLIKVILASRRRNGDELFFSQDLLIELGKPNYYDNQG